MIVATLAVFDKGLWELLEGGFKSGELSLAAKGFLPVALGAGSAVLVPASRAGVDVLLLPNCAKSRKSSFQTGRTLLRWLASPCPAWAFR